MRHLLSFKMPPDFNISFPQLVPNPWDCVGIHVVELLSDIKYKAKEVPAVVMLENVVILRHRNPGPGDYVGSVAFFHCL